VVGRQNADIANNLHLRDVAMVTTFWLSMGYNFGSMIVSDTLFDSGVGFRGQAIRRRYSRFEDVARQPFFGFLYMGCTLAPPGEYD